MPFCPNCGVNVKQVERFCSNCGRPQGVIGFQKQEQQKTSSKTKLIVPQDFKLSRHYIISLTLLFMVFFAIGVTALVLFIFTDNRTNINSNPLIFEESYSNQIGNTTGNIANTGLAHQQGQWIYYINDADGNSIYKIHADGSGKSKINDENSRFINVVDDWIYYSSYADGSFQKADAAYLLPASRIAALELPGNIYRIRTDGSTRSKLNEDICSYILVDNGWIYYQNYSDEGKLYKIRTDGGERTKLNDRQSVYMNIIGEWIYYLGWEEEPNIYKIRTDGTDETLIIRDRALLDDGRPIALALYPFFLNIVENWIYCTTMDMVFFSDSRISKINIDGSSFIHFDDNRNSFYLNVADGWIYYINMDDKGRIYKVKTDSTEKTLVCDDTAWLINLAGDWIYYSNKDDGDKFYRIKIDGSERQKVN